jgi:hypothetical protein
VAMIGILKKKKKKNVLKLIDYLSPQTMCNDGKKKGVEKRFFYGSFCHTVY